MFERERGRRQHLIIDDPLTRRGVEFWLERVDGFYGPGGGVDVEVIADQVALTPRSADYLYGEYTPRASRYVAGSRPLLERIVRATLRPGMSQREQALALLYRVRDNRDHGMRSPTLFYGGSEEELVKRGADMCNEVARLYVCLCWIAGLPARLHCTHITGHMMAEVLTDGAWGWCDPQKGLAAVRDDDAPASAWDLVRDPRLFERQPRRVWEAVRLGPERTPPAREIARLMAMMRDCCFHPREAQALGNYAPWDMDRHTFPWIREPVDAAMLALARQHEAANRVALGWPIHFFDPNAFDEPLKTRAEDAGAAR